MKEYGLLEDKVGGWDITETEFSDACRALMKHEIEMTFDERDLRIRFPDGYETVGRMKSVDVLVFPFHGLDVEIPITSVDVAVEDLPPTRSEAERQQKLARETRPPATSFVLSVLPSSIDEIVDSRYTQAEIREAINQLRNDGLIALRDDRRFAPT